MVWTHATSDSADRWFQLEWQDLSEPVEGCFRDHRHPLERTEVLRPSRQAFERNRLMTAVSNKPVRCAIYTRVSTDQGLDCEASTMMAVSRAATLKGQSSSGS